MSKNPVTFGTGDIPFTGASGSLATYLIDGGVLRLQLLVYIV